MKLTFVAFLTVVAAFAFEVSAQSEESFCGMEYAKANMPDEFREQSALRTEALALRAEELLLFLDFDGAVVRRGFPNPSGDTSPIISGSVRTCPAPALTAEQIAEVIALVEDDFSPFNITVTTNYDEFLTYPAQNKQICIVTTNPAVIGFPSGVGGVAPAPTFLGDRSPFNPCFVFSGAFLNNPVDVASVTSHEVGHTMGLGHQHHFSESCGFLEEYQFPFGTGRLSFSPIMGSAEGPGIVNWFAQSCPSPLYFVSQNDFDLLNSQVDLREDDFPDSPTGGFVSEGDLTGTLEFAGDVDFMRINFKGPGLVTVTSENIDLRVSVFNPGGKLISEHNDPDDRNVTIPGAKGARYLKIEAENNENMSSEFMTGRYKIFY